LERRVSSKESARLWEKGRRLFGRDRRKGESEEGEAIPRGGTGARMRTAGQWLKNGNSARELGVDPSKTKRGEETSTATRSNASKNVFNRVKKGREKLREIAKKSTRPVKNRKILKQGPRKKKTSPPSNAALH